MPLPSHLLPAKTKHNVTPGLIYLSHIPPGMGPAKVKHLLSAYGEVGRIYLARDPKEERTRKKDKHHSYRFVEGWVEFEDKRIARSVAELLNAKSIGGKKGSKWFDDVWTMKYLPKFRWDMLSEQVALEKATQKSLLRFHLENSKREQENYLTAVEKNKQKKRIAERSENETEDAAPKKQRRFNQRQVVEKKEHTASDDGQLDSVLSKLF